MTTTSKARRSARAAEPAGIGSARARDPLALEVRLLGALLGQVITEQAGEAIYDLVERLRLAAIAFRQDEQPGRPGTAGGRARRARAGGRRGRHHRLFAVLPAGQPRRGTGACPDAASPGTGRTRRTPRRLGGRGSRPAATCRAERGRPRRDLRPAADHPGPHRAPDRGAPTHDAGRPPPLCGAAGAARRRAAHARPTTARCVVGCARRSRSCGGPAISGP